MITDQDVAKVCAGIYNPATPWQHLWDADIYAGLNNDILCFRGSITADDWFRDLDAVSVLDPILGGVHAGFSKGLSEFYTEIVQFLRPGTLVCGHSLGAARALLFGAYMEQAGLRPRAIITFGSPLPGFLRLAEILAPVPIRSYRNALDPVNDVPAPFYPNLPYLHPREPIRMMEIPTNISLDPLAFHNVNLYARGTPPTEIV